MSNRIVKTPLLNGSKNFILHIYLESDGEEGELTNYVLVDPVNDYPEFLEDKSAKNIRPTVAQLWYGFSWFDCLLAFDDLVPAPSWVLPRDSCGYYDFRYFGGISDRYALPQDQQVNDKTGQILISTSGFAPAGQIGTLILELRKH